MKTGQFVRRDQPALACAKVGLYCGNRTVPLVPFLFPETSRRTGVYARFRLQPVLGPAFMPGCVRLICRFSLSAPFMGLLPRRIGGKRRPVNGPDKVITVWNRTDRTGGFT